MGWPQGVGFERLYDGPGQFPLVFVSDWATLLVWTTIGLLLAAGFYRSGGSAPAAVLLALAMRRDRLRARSAPGAGRPDAW
jgi:hypothetical protein